MMLYTVKSGKWSAQIAPEFGGNVIKLTYAGENVFVPLQNPDQLKNDPYLQGAPILLPANRTRDARFSFEGREYRLTVNEKRNGAHLHGLVHTQEFTVLRHQPEEMVLSFENKGEIYPFPFVLTVEYAIREDAFVQTYHIQNSGNTAMPVTFALHTTFVEPDTFSVPIDACQEKDDLHLPTGRYVALSPQESAYVSGSASKGKIISGYYRACGLSAKVGKFTYTASEEFDHWVLFNARGERGLLCVEPQCGAVDGLNHGACRVILPGETLTLWTRLDEKYETRYP